MVIDNSEDILKPQSQTLDNHEKTCLEQTHYLIFSGINDKKYKIEIWERTASNQFQTQPYSQTLNYTEKRASDKRTNLFWTLVICLETK